MVSACNGVISVSVCDDNLIRYAALESLFGQEFGILWSGQIATQYETMLTGMAYLTDTQLFRRHWHFCPQCYNENVILWAGRYASQAFQLF